MAGTYCPKHETVISIVPKNFCPVCGTELVEAPKDPECKCGNRLTKHERFCSNCGLSREEALRPLSTPEKENQE